VNESRLEKLAPLSGIAMIVFLMTGVVLINAFDYMPTADRAAEVFGQNPGRVESGGYFGVVSGLFLIWFAGSVYSALREAEGGTGRLSTIAFGGGVMSAIGLVTGYGVMALGGSQAGLPEGISPAQALILHGLFEVLIGLLHGLAVLIGATGILSLRTKSFPAWFGWASVVITIGILTPVDYIFEGIALLWIVVISSWLFIRGLKRRESFETPAQPSGARMEI
jgi:hypothetical protein